MDPFTIVNLLDLDDVVSARVEGLEGRFGRDQLDSRDLGVSHWRYAPGVRATTGHRHGEQEEAYIVVSGSGRRYSRRGTRASPVGRRALCAAGDPRFRGGARGHGHHRRRRAQAGGARRGDGRRRLAGLTPEGQSTRRRLPSADAAAMCHFAARWVQFVARSNCRGITRGEHPPSWTRPVVERTMPYACSHHPQDLRLRVSRPPSSRSATSTTTCASGTTTAERRASARPSRSAASPAARPSPGAAICSPTSRRRTTAIPPSGTSRGRWARAGGRSRAETGVSPAPGWPYPGRLCPVAARAAPRTVSCVVVREPPA